MKEKKKLQKASTTSRRNFIAGSALSAAGFMIVPRYVLGGKGYIAPSDKLNIAGVGVGGRGYPILKDASLLNEKKKTTVENVVALCDVDDVRAAKAYENYPKAKKFKDFRVMLDEMKGDIDAVTIGTPDHTHAVIAMAAMQMGKHVYVEKPLTHNVYEARMLTEAANKYNVATQMGNQGNSSNDIRRICEWIWAGEIGNVTEVQTWTNRPIWPQGKQKPTEKPPIPDTLAWDLWLGPAPYRDYHPDYLPFKWRGWRDFGTGALGDMACHIIDPVFKSLKLGYPTSVEASASTLYIDDFVEGDLSESFPSSSVIHFQFPEREGMPPVKLNWYDGGLRPQRPEELEDNEQMGDPNGGVIFIGDKGKIMCGCYAANPTLLPSSKMKDFKEPKQTLDRVEDGHQRSWVAACKGGKPASSNFDYAGPLTETVLMGNLAIKSYYLENGRKKLLWDGKNMKITNFKPANDFVKRQYRDGWTLGV
ncbi:Gfo/Idh/MocA family protein [Chondrinema litorale]|uniref:Gfo/Idh/MocA family protein n=1 Tax=Chondrinema litorale TaxID=2994555 RepID=UPI002542FF69|nr:Gfo/Idh/MocA family oxidoreductase [Chondrinema litorale]UZR92599.1 Gfo/Idh/MocA family oxidoreductase [Chondrinema litorale]